MEEKLILSQVNPHFIYNVLNTVIFLARKGKNQEVVEVTDSFIHLLRDAVRPGKADMFATISQEIDILEHYLKIQEYRYQDAYQVILDVEEEALQATVQGRYSSLWWKMRSYMVFCQMKRKQVLSGCV